MIISTKDIELDTLSAVDLVELCLTNFALWCRLMFPSRFYLEFGKLHEPLLEVLDDRSIQRIVVAAPRGIGKTSMFQLGLPSREIAMEQARYVVPISNTQAHSIKQSDSLRKQFQSNRFFRKMFGDLKSGVWGKEEWEAHHKETDYTTRIEPKGVGQQIRGLLWEDWRPDLVIADDLEKTQGVMSEVMRENLDTWFWADLYNVLNKNVPDPAQNQGEGRIIVIGTILHEDSIISNLLEDPDWVGVNLEICNEMIVSNWEEGRPTEVLRREKEAFDRRGKLHIWYMENRNLIVPPNQSFSQGMFRRYWETDKITSELKDLENVIIADFGKTTNVKSAHSAVVGLGISMSAGVILVRDCRSGLLKPDEVYDTIFNMARDLKATVLGAKVTGLNEFVSYPIRNEMIKRRQMMELVEIVERGRKEDRIRQLLPYYTEGRILHNNTICSVIEEQLISFPRGKRVDVIDALADVIPMLERGERYFGSEGLDVAEEEKELLEIQKEAREEAYDADWRLVI